MANKSFLLGGTIVYPSQIDEIHIYKSEKEWQDLVLPNGRSPMEVGDPRYVVSCLGAKAVKGVSLLTYKFITSLPEEKEEPRKASAEPPSRNVFIVHGKDRKPLKELKTMLTDFGLKSNETATIHRTLKAKEN